MVSTMPVSTKTRFYLAIFYGRFPGKREMSKAWRLVFHTRNSGMLCDLYAAGY